MHKKTKPHREDEASLRFREINFVLQAPCAEGEVGFHRVLDEVGEVVEEVDTRILFEVADGDSVLTQVSVGAVDTIVFMFDVEAEGGIDSILYLEESHVIVLGYGHLSGCHVEGVFVDVVERTAFDNIECVGKRLVAAQRLYFIFESCPEVLVETCDLGAHIAHVEGLVVGFARIKTVV